ncbi:hypothetical protein [Novosphingobium sp. ES2-1]|uniref:hypothetical protein n=1 Tax=Novosphingobium sp. ES2-1 TaxID=2780074 RepID=UPI00187F419C|nr:hypothetical protein [Novosphingobium sp. ES2-1]QOV96032.1 hypothetical protein IM701_16760 [Novosphingobium sp. ES2-1]
MSNARKKVPVATILDANDKELMAIRKIEPDGNTLVIRGKIFGAMPMVAKLTPAEARAALKLLDLRTVLFLLTFLFRKN